MFSFIESKEKEHNWHHRPFYIDNDFYNNKYPLIYQGTSYYKILRRSINDWEEFDYYCGSKNINNNKVVDISHFLSKNMA